jgi:hypothetical protein
MRVARSRQSWLFDIADHACRRLNGAVGVEQGNGCVAPGHYGVGVNLYSDRELAKGAQSIPVRVEITGLNPQVTTLFAKEVALDQVGQTINVASFDVTLDGRIKLVEPPLEPITDAYRKDKP